MTFFSLSIKKTSQFLQPANPLLYQLAFGARNRNHLGCLKQRETQFTEISAYEIIGTAVRAGSKGAATWLKILPQQLWPGAPCSCRQCHSNPSPWSWGSDDGIRSLAAAKPISAWAQLSAIPITKGLMSPFLPFSESPARTSQRQNLNTVLNLRGQRV